MNPELKSKWVAALRSGDYEQGTGALRDLNNRFCCLGVLCDIVDPTKWVDRQNDFPKSCYAYEYQEGEFKTALLPPQLCVDSGFSSFDDGFFDTPEAQLVSMNDDGKPFEVIAEYIEANL